MFTFAFPVNLLVLFNDNNHPFIPTVRAFHRVIDTRCLVAKIYTSFDRSTRDGPIDCSGDSEGRLTHQTQDIQCAFHARRRCPWSRPIYAREAFNICVQGAEIRNGSNVVRAANVASLTVSWISSLLVRHRVSPERSSGVFVFGRLYCTS